MSELVSQRLAAFALIAIVAVGSGCTSTRNSTAVSSSTPSAKPRVAISTRLPSPPSTASASQVQTASPVPSQVATATAAPSAPSTPTPPTQTPSSTVTLVPGSTLAPNPTPDAAPRILDVALSKTVFGVGEVISGTMTTTANVASVQAKIGTFGIAVPKTGAGRFELSYRVPPVAFLFRGPLTLHLVARSFEGDEAVRDIQITIR